MMIAHRRTLVLVGTLTAALALPGDALGCWDICTSAFGGEFYANGTLYQLTSCTQTWTDGASGPQTTCKYTNVYRPTTRM